MYPNYFHPKCISKEHLEKKKKKSLKSMQVINASLILTAR